ncbi:MAG: hypothetical protein P8L23_06380 [Flavobacteriales bacterium]|nr:hypothetical protein [Flavobacteriales bacterium]
MKIKLTLFILIVFINQLKSQPSEHLDLNNYKYLVINKINGDGLLKTVRKTTYNELINSGYNVVFLKKVGNELIGYPKALSENPNLGLYLTVDVLEDLLNGNDTVSMKLYDHKNNLAWSSAKSGKVIKESTKACLSYFTNFNYSYNSSNRPIPSFELKSQNFNSVQEVIFLDGKFPSLKVRNLMRLCEMKPSEFKQEILKFFSSEHRNQPNSNYSMCNGISYTKTWYRRDNYKMTILSYNKCPDGSLVINLSDHAYNIPFISDVALELEDHYVESTSSRSTNKQGTYTTESNIYKINTDNYSYKFQIGHTSPGGLQSLMVFKQKL